MLNETQEMISGIRISVKEYSKVAFAFERLTNPTIFQKYKKIYKILCSKDEFYK